ncbi:MAG: ribosome-binding factor A [Glaciecola sp.]
MTRRNPKVDGLVREALAAILKKDVSDPRLSMVTIMEVQVTQDHDHATVFYSVVDPSLVSSSGRKEQTGDHLPSLEEVADGLASAAPRIRGLLGKRVRLRRTPALKFVHDPVQETASKVEELLRGLNQRD